MRIDDEVFDLAEENTLFSLRNGGGKSVLVQMMMAPFVHKRYRRLGERSFESYFTSNEPTFILVEWCLDNDAGYVLTGMMVRRNQEINEDGAQELEIINLIHEYNEENEVDIKHIPLVIQSGNSRKLKGFHACRQQFEKWKQDSEIKFDYFDMNVSAKSRSYFQKLQEYGIFYEEWESIIHKINQKESGLSDLFKEAKDERGLVEGWFLPAIEKKLNKDKNHIQEFEKLLHKFIVQYKENQSRFENKERILKFQELTIPLKSLEEELYNNLTKIQNYELSLGDMIKTLNTLLDENAQKMLETSEVLLELEASIKQLKYEESSLEIYLLDDEIDAIQLEFEFEEEKLVGLEQESIRLKKEQAKLVAARLYEDYTEASEELQKSENQLAIAQQSHEKLLPLKQNLGYTLRLKYEELLEKLQLEWSDSQKTRENLEANQLFHQQEAQSMQQKLRSVEQQIGQKQGWIQIYDDLESSYNQEFGTRYARNLMGDYEPQFLENKKDEIEVALQESAQKKRKSLSRLKELEEKEHSLSRLIQDNRQKIGTFQAELKSEKKHQQELELQKEIRITLLPYINWPLSSIYDEAGILEAFTLKIKESELGFKALQKDADQLLDQIKKLKDGTILELPKELVQALEEEGIHYMLGMDWLKYNKKTVKQNQQLVSANPFIPYSLILPKEDLKRFKAKNPRIFTVFPIPILIREDIEQELSQREGNFSSFRELHFYVYFNGKLLSEKYVKELLQGLEEKLNQKQKEITIKSSEIALYREKEAVIRYQELSAKTYKLVEEEVERLTSAIEGTEEEYRHLQEQLSQCQQEAEESQQILSQIESSLLRLGNQSQRLDGLLEKYSKYREGKTALNVLKQERKQLESGANEHLQKQMLLQQELKQCESFLHQLDTRLQKEKTELQQFLSYQEGNIITKDLEDLKAQYTAIIQKMSGEVVFYEEMLTKARHQLGKTEKLLLAHQHKHQLDDEDFKNLTFSDYKLETIEKNMEAYEQDMARQKKHLYNLDRTVAVEQSKRNMKYELLLKTFEVDGLLPKVAVVARDFALELAKIESRKRRFKEEESHLLEKERIWREQRGMLASYEHFEAREDWVFDLSMAELNQEEWSQLRGSLNRDYQEEKKKTEKLFREIESQFNLLKREKMFEEDSFKKPLENLYGLNQNPHSFLEHYHTIMEAFAGLLEKLEVDISRIEDEKRAVIQLLLDFVERIHESMGKIDQNSSIQVRNKSLKMLKLKIPDWESHAEEYYLRLENFLMSLTERCLKLLSENQVIDELIGQQVKTNLLYDTVVGTANIGVNLYKIEEQREVPINWEQVSKNSGGEGFLSAFIILNSLLSFMRRDETDIYAAKTEGKVLVMDNPFAQTNAAHLLKPLMELAKKNNTQLICLSGLGGDSIYSRFENIYSLNLIPSIQKRGLEFVKSERIKGEQLVMLPSRIYVQEEITLF